VLGPFKTENLLHGLTNVFAPEEKIDLKKTYDGVREEIKWTAKPDFKDGAANLLVQDLHGVHGAYYLYRTIKVSQPRKMELSLRADDVFKLWVNDKLVTERTAKEKVGEPPLTVSVDLKKGENKVLLKVVTTQGAAYFTFKNDLENSEMIPADVAALFAATKKFNPAQQAKVRNVYRRMHSPEFKQMFDTVEKWKEQNDAIEKAIPRRWSRRKWRRRERRSCLCAESTTRKADKVGTGLARDFATVAEGCADQPAWVREVARRSVASADGTRDRESLLAALLRHRPCEDGGGLRSAGR
jgi:hypothetical protein